MIKVKFSHPHSFHFLHEINLYTRNSKTLGTSVLLISTELQPMAFLEDLKIYENFLPPLLLTWKRAYCLELNSVKEL